MISRWNDHDAPPADDPVALRVYTSRLLGSDPDLVLHGGGNTSVKVRTRDFFGHDVDVLYVKGSGWDLATIEAEGFAPVRLATLRALADLDTLSDADMVRQQRVALLDPGAPNPSVEAVLHAIVPFRYVDHTHADAVVTMTNTPEGEAWVRSTFGPRVLIVPYVMPGFDLCREVKRLTDDVDWSRLDGLILMNHGVFTFADDARESYEAMISLVETAERALAELPDAPASDPPTTPPDALQLAEIRSAASRQAGRPLIAIFDGDEAPRTLASRPDVHRVAARGPATPDHVIRTKPKALVLPRGEGASVVEAFDRYAETYRRYVAQHAAADTIALDPAPRWVVIPDVGSVALGRNAGAARIVRDIARHTAAIIGRAEAAGGWTPLPERQLFEVEYWELEQAKLKRAGAGPALEGRVALVTGAASGIGAAIAARLLDEGAAVVALDVDPAVVARFDRGDAVGIVCDVTDGDQLGSAVRLGVRTFGGLDALVTNAGFLPASAPIERYDRAAWQRSLDVNLTASAQLFAEAIPFLRHGWQPSIVIVGSKNVAAPGVGASAYSVAKAGLTQLGRLAALELAPDGIRVNTVHPDAVFDTALWTDEVLEQRAAHYGLTVEAYRTRNLLKTEVRSRDVANVVLQLISDEFRTVTGAQIPVDGGNDRVV